MKACELHSEKQLYTIKSTEEKKNHSSHSAHSSSKPETKG